MRYILELSDNARETLAQLAAQNNRRLIKVRKTLALMEANIRHQGLHTHKYNALEGPNGEEVFEAYIENNTPGAYRIFWHYGPGRGIISIIAITPHP